MHLTVMYYRMWDWSIKHFLNTTKFVNGIVGVMVSTLTWKFRVLGLSPGVGPVILFTKYNT